MDVGIGIGIAKKFFFLAKFLFLPFKVSYEENIYGEVLFKYPCTPFWEFLPCLEQLFCRKPVSRKPFAERYSTVDVISGVFKTPTAESCILHVCKFLIRNPLEITSWKFFVSFKASLRNLGVRF